MDLLVVIVIVVVSMLGGLIKKAGESGGGRSMPGRSRLPPRPYNPQSPGSFGTSALDSNREQASPGETYAAMGETEGFGSSEEGYGSSSEGPPETAVLETLIEQSELERERTDFLGEAGHLTSDPRETQADSAIRAADAPEYWMDETSLMAASPSTKEWFAGRDDLIKAVVAVEILGRPGGWRAGRVSRRR